MERDSTVSDHDQIVDKIRDLYTELKMLAPKLDQIYMELDAMYRKSPSSLSLCYVYNATYELSELLNEALSKQVNTINMRLANVEIIAAMERDGVPSQRLSNPPVLFSMGTRVSASMPDKVAGMAWLQENGHGDMIQPTVNAASLASFAKNYTLETGMDLPEDIFKVSSMRYIQRKKS